MPIETFGNNIGTLVATNPVGSEPKSQGDNHLRGIKAVLLAQFPGFSAPITATHTQVNYVTGVTSPIQTQLNTKETVANVAAAVLLLAPKNNPMFTGSVTVPAPVNVNDAVNKDYVDTIAFASGAVSSVTGTAPIVSSGGPTPVISMATATASVSGHLTAADWAKFNAKQDALVSATNIKTINGVSVLGSGNVVVMSYDAGANAIGSYCLGQSISGSVSRGGTISGSSLRDAGGSAGGSWAATATAFSGTWRAMSYTNPYGLFQRIA